MCGIAGYVDFNAAPNRARLEAMARSLARRGPDAQAVAVSGPCGFAHTRLSIIDVLGSPQPMALPGCDVALVYNGELYNYLSLRSELKACGQRLVTGGDTEALLRWVELEWTAALTRLEGMFAFAAWDGRAQKLLLARDALGEKPLYYATPAPNLLVFGSEAKALIEHPAVDRSLDEEALRQALRFRAVYGEHCLHRGIRQLQPGAWLEFSREGIRRGVFYDLIKATDEDRDRQSGADEETLVEVGWSLFKDSVRGRLIADVPVGAFLSGGLDSSLVTATMRQIRAPNEKIETFSVGYEGDPHSELPFAEQVAGHVGSNHTAVSVGPESFIRRLAELSHCRDGPVSEPADVAVAEMSRVARQSVKVVLSGEGADEVFGGYPKNGLADAPRALGVALRTIGPVRAARLAGMAGIDRTRALVAARALAQSREVDRIVQWFSYLDRGELATLFPDLGWDDAQWAATVRQQEAALSHMAAATPLCRMQTVDCLTWLPGNMLERGDRMTMAEGLEMRPPFLAKDLAAFGLALPDRLKVSGGVGKRMVRRWAQQLLPPEIVNRRKWGFRAPLAQWFRQPLRPMLNDYLTRRDGLCGSFGDARLVVEMLESHQSGRTDASASLWTLLSAEVWYQDVYLARRARLAPAAVA